MSVAATHMFTGACHCGAIRARFETRRAADDLQVRACQCGFCTRHGTMTVSDPAGHCTFDIERAALVPYQFATRTATSLVCARCGVYAGVYLEDAGRMWSVVNTRGMAMAPFLGRTPEPVTYTGETADQRIARRKVKWTPTTITYR